MRFFSSSALASAPKLRFAANCSAAETMSHFLPRPLRRLPAKTGHSADAGHYLVLGFDKSIVCPANCPHDADDDADVTPPRLRPSWPGPGFSPCRPPSRPPQWLISKRDEPRYSA